MFTVFRIILIVFLVLLQFFSPLLHAHTGNKSSSFGIHVPGLEGLGIASDVSTDIIVALSCKAFSCEDDEGMVVGVTTGLMSVIKLISDDNHKVDFIPDSKLFLPQPVTSIKLTILAIIATFFLQFLPLSKPFSLSVQAPRAPPNYIVCNHS